MITQGFLEESLLIYNSDVYIPLQHAKNHLLIWVYLISVVFVVLHFYINDGYNLEK